MKKLYYSIGEVSEICEVEPHVLRYWETKFSNLKPNKNKAGKRLYTDKDIETILKLKTLIKEERYSTDGAKRALRRQKEQPIVAENALSPSTIRDLKEVRIFLQHLLERL